MTIIIPRWEWRTFADDMAEYGKSLTKYGEAKIKKTEEKYILSQQSDENVKIRFDVVDVKSLRNINSDGLEQWDPIMKEGFPINKENLQKLFAILKFSLPNLEKDIYSYEEFLEEVVKPCQQLRIVDVKKERYIYSINDCAVEYAKTEFDGKPYETACVEHIDPAVVMQTVKELGLLGKTNINYITAMKKSVGLK
jgi:exopolyphosphatase/guanosine-5'-triphosphate,3'-diphosphate pyrophosphatase